MTVAALVLGIFGTVLAALSLGWNIAQYLLTGARPKLTPVVGIATPSGLAINDGTRDVAGPLLATAATLPPGPFVIGVTIVNDGRAPFHVTNWAVRADPSTVSFVPLGEQIGGPAVPCDIAPGAEATFVTELANGRALASAGEAADGKPQRITITVTSGSRKFTTKPVMPKLLELQR